MSIDIYPVIMLLVFTMQQCADLNLNNHRRDGLVQTITIGICCIFALQSLQTMVNIISDPIDMSLDNNPAYDLCTFSSLLESIYKGLNETPLWQGFLCKLRTEMSANICFLILRNPNPGDAGLLLSDGLPPALSGSPNNVYSDGLYAIDPFANLPSDQVTTLEEFVPTEQLLRSEFYLRCMQPFDLLHILGVDMQLPGSLRVSLRITRCANAPSFTAKDKEKITLLIPHLQQAIPLYARLQQMETERSLLDRTVSQLSLGTIILDDGRRVLHCNAVADRIITEKDGIYSKDRQILITHSSEANHFRQLINNAIDAHKQSKPYIVQAMAISRKAGRLPLNIVVRSMPQVSQLDGQTVAAVAIFISDPEYKSHTSAEILGQLYGLTPAESRLAMALADGHSLEDASNSLHISRNTARAHLRAIFAKTGVTQQTMLVSLLLKSVAAFLASSR
jgi:DNA-binding CsgD family transcriptional regulator